MIATAIAVGAAMSPLSGYSVGQGPADSPLVLGFMWAESRYGLADASLLVAIVATIAAAAGAAAALPRGPSGRAVLGLAVMMLIGGSAAAHATDITATSRLSTRTFDGRSPQWVDAYGVRGVTMIQTAGSDPITAMEHAIWNGSIKSAARLGAAVAIDGGRSQISLTRTGVMRREGERIVGPILVATGGTRTVFEGARRIGEVRNFSLFSPTTRALRLAAMVEGLASDGWLAAPSTIRVFSRPGECRRARLTLTLPAGRPPVTITVVQGGSKQRIRVAAGVHASIALDSSAGVPERAEIATKKPIFLGGPLRRVAARATLEVNSCRL